MSPMKIYESLKVHCRMI